MILIKNFYSRFLQGILFFGLSTLPLNSAFAIVVRYPEKPNERIFGVGLDIKAGQPSSKEESKTGQDTSTAPNTKTPAAAASAVQDTKATANVDPEVIKRLEAASHEQAQAEEFKSVCGIFSQIVNNTHIEMATGTYIHGQGGRGFIMTAAHPFLEKEAKDFVISFRSASIAGKAITIHAAILVTQIHIHPSYRDKSPGSPNDIALLEFNLKDLPKGISPMRVDAKTDYKESEEFFEATLIGYGDFGTNRSELQSLGKSHLGKTWVRFQYDDKKNPNFVFLAPHLANSSEIEFEDLHHFATQISLDSLDEGLYEGLSSQFRMPLEQIRIHKEQGVCMGGDSGGPLLFKAKTGAYKLAGIAKSSHKYHAATQNKKVFHVFENRWEPFFPHKEWIYKTMGIPPRQ